MTRPVLYFFSRSAPCRIALLTARHLGLDVEVKEVNLAQKDQLKDDFLKVNPQHTVPVLVDGDFVLTESRAIAIYLTEKKFPNGHSLYPIDLKQRAVINQRLYYDGTVLFPRIRAICGPALHSGATKIADSDRQHLFDAVDHVDKRFFKGNQFIAGTDQPTLADISFVTSIANFVSIGGDLKKYPNIDAWFETCKNLPGSDENLAGAKIFGDAVKKSLKDTL